MDGDFGGECTESGRRAGGQLGVGTVRSWLFSARCRGSPRNNRASSLPARTRAVYYHFYHFWAIDPRFCSPQNEREPEPLFAGKMTLPLLPLCPQNTTKVRRILIWNVRDCNRSLARYNVLQHNRFYAVRQACRGHLRNRGLGVRVPPARFRISQYRGIGFREDLLQFFSARFAPSSRLRYCRK